MAKERVRNPVTRRYYRIQQRNTKARRKGQIQGRWHRDR